MRQFELWLAPSVIAIVALAGLILLMMKLMKLVQNQNQMIRSLSNLTASKDLAAYVALEKTNNSEINDGIQFVPLDDESVARRLASEYSDNGMDPSMAYAKEDDPLIDFGGTEAFH